MTGAEALRDPLLHNAWATRELLSFCTQLSEEQMQATAPGAFGSLIDTLRHFVTSEGGYRYSLTGKYPEWEDWSPDEQPGLDVLIERAKDNELFWGEFLSGQFDPERNIVGPKRTTRAGIVIAQVINHSNEHRSQAFAIITELGLEPPQLDGWRYGVASGRLVRTA